MEASAGLAVQASFLVVLGVGGARVAGGAAAGLVADRVPAVPVAAVRPGDRPGHRRRPGPGRPGRGEPDEELQRCRWNRWPRGGHRARHGPRAGLGLVLRGVVPLPGYRPVAAWVHRGLTFEVPPGGVTAIVGPSGTGKSTIFALLERFHEPQRGTVAVDGVDVRAWPLPDLRAALGYVEQDAPILAGTLRENLRLAAPDASDEDPRRAVPHPPGGAGRPAPEGPRRRSATAAARCPAASGSGSRSPGRCCAGQGCCCWTRRPRSSTRPTSSRCARWSTPSRPRPRWWSSPTGCPASPARTGSSS